MFVHKFSITFCLLELRLFCAKLCREKSDTQCACRTLCQSVLRNTEQLDTCVKVVCTFLAFWTLSATLRRATIISIMSVRPTIYPSVSPSALKTSAHVGQIFVKFLIGISYWNLSISFNFGQIRTNITGTLHEDLLTLVTTSFANASWGYHLLLLNVLPRQPWLLKLPPIFWLPWLSRSLLLQLFLYLFLLTRLLTCIAGYGEAKEKEIFPCPDV